MHHVYLDLGSNLEPEKNIPLAMYTTKRPRKTKIGVKIGRKARICDSVFMKSTSSIRNMPPNANPNHPTMRFENFGIIFANATKSQTVVKVHIAAWREGRISMNRLV